ncbi:MAG: hypothetical protein JSS99_16255 [Actinobacteria bacterium]|nr:hypothetical protein [Actinomycetota bacterium]
MQRWTRRLACGACAALLAAGCGESTKPDRTGTRRQSAAVVAAPRRLDDPARAESALVRRDDIPGNVVAARDLRNHAPCSPRVLFRDSATGVATTPRYVTDAARAQQSVLLFRDVRTAAAAFARLDSPANRRCIVSYTHAVAVSRVHQPLAPLTRETLLVEPVGQQSTSYRLTIPIPRHDVAVDTLLNRIGRAISSVSIVWEPASKDLEFQNALVARIGSRVRRALR